MADQDYRPALARSIANVAGLALQTATEDRRSDAALLEAIEVARENLEVAARYLRAAEEDRLTRHATQLERVTAAVRSAAERRGRPLDAHEVYLVTRSVVGGGE